MMNRPFSSIKDRLSLAKVQVNTKDITEDDFELRDELLSWTKDKKSRNALSCYEVMVHKLCNERCFFCSQDHESRVTAEKPDDRLIYKRILFWAKEWYGMLGFTWWEPLTHPHILKYIQFAKKAWFRYIRIQTNGTMLWIPWFAKKCIDAGTTIFKLSVHHYKSEVHDYLVWLPWALEKVRIWIREIKKLWWRMGINVVLTEQNYRDLPEILLHYLDMGVTSYVIIFPLYEFSMKEQSSVVGFKFTDTIEYVVKSLHIFDKLWLKRPLVLNLPMCLLPWYESAIIQTFNGTAVLNLDGSKTNIDDNKAIWKTRLPICEDCDHNKICFWVDDEYINTWWKTEFAVRKTNLEYNFDFKDLSLQSYFTEDELCFLEIISKKNPANIDDIITLKDTIQICQDCDSMNKIISTWETLIEKWFIKKTLKEWKVSYSKVI